MSEELLVGQRCVVELVVIVLGTVEELTVSGVHLVVVLRELHVEVGDPAELTVDVALLGELGVVGHARALHIVLFIGIQLALRVEQHLLLVLEVLVEVLLRKRR